MMSALPLEIVTLIFQFASRSSRLSAVALSQVSRWVRDVVYPDLWSVLVIEQNHNNSYSIKSIDDNCGATQALVRAAPFAGVPDEAQDHVHSIFIIPSALIRELRLSQSLHPLIRDLLRNLPCLQRLAYPESLYFHISVNLQLLKMFNVATPPPITELYVQPAIVSPASTNPTPSEIAASPQTFDASSLTHLRMGTLIDYTQDVNNDISPYITIQLHLSGTPVTHLAFEYAAERLFIMARSQTRRLATEQFLGALDVLPSEARPSSESDRPDTAEDADTLQDGIFPAAVSKHLTLQCVVILLRDLEPGRALAFTDDGGPFPASTSPSARPWDQADAEARVDRVDDERLLPLWIGAAPRNDWMLWERLAREDRSIWDEAREQRRRREERSLALAETGANPPRLGRRRRRLIRRLGPPTHLTIPLVLVTLSTLVDVVITCLVLRPQACHGSWMRFSRLKRGSPEVL